MPQKKKKKSSCGRDTASSSSNSSLTASEQHEQQEETESPHFSRSQKDEQSSQKRAEFEALLDELDHTLGRAPVARSDCVEGVKRADEAIAGCVKEEREEDEGVRCSLQLKRAQLLKVVFDKRYGGEGLAPRHQKPLESCISDCQQVMSYLRGRNEEFSTTEVYQEAKTLLVQAKKLKREEDPEVRTRSGTAVSQSHHPTPIPLFFEPGKVHIKDVSEIHPILLQDVVNCYKKYKYVCRVCFIRYDRQEIVVGGKPCRQCKNVATVRIMPASKLCKNFRDFKILAIPPPPKVLMAPTNRHKPFLFCRNHDHLLCYDRAKESWYAHSIEELVVWNVERHYDCSFTEYVNKHHVEVASAGSRDTAEQKETENIDSFSDEQEEYEFYPSESFFPRGLVSIPKHLLDDIVKCYGERREYCKTCFYKMGKKGELTVGPQNSSLCKLCRRPWQRVVVMPSSRICWNFGDFDVIPIAPLPRSKLMSQYCTFKYCNNDDHYRCFRVYIENEFWYAHSVEEMVIWTVEREKDCTFSQFINKSRTPALPPPGLSLPTSPPPQGHTPLTKSPTPTTTTTTAQSTTAPSSTAETDTPLETAPPQTKGQSSSKISSTNSPSFSQVVVAGPPVKIRPPTTSGGKQKGVSTVQEKSESHSAGLGEVDRVSVSSNSSALDVVGSGAVATTTGPRLTGLTTSPPSSVAAVAARATSPRGGALDIVVGPPGNHPATSTTKIRHLSESSYMTALSQDSVSSSHGHGDLSQESVQSLPLKSRGVVESAKTSSQNLGRTRSSLPRSSTRGRPNYKVVQPMRTEGVGEAKKGLDAGNLNNVPPAIATDDGKEQTNANFTSSEVSNAELEYLSVNCASDAEPHESAFSPSHTSVAGNDLTPLHLATTTDGDFTTRTPLANGGFVPTPVTNTGFGSHQTGNTGFVAGYRPSRPPGYANAPVGFSSRLEGVVAGNHQGFTPSYGLNVENTLEVLKFSLVNFRAFSEVPLPLVMTIAASYESRREVCRKCFFGERSLCGEESGVCEECGQPWENPVTVIPGCKECSNEPCFDSDDHVPIHPLPPVANIRKCQLKNHHKCFQKSLESNPKFAHSIEQLVVWLIESEKDCSFQDFVRGELQMLRSHPRPDSTSHHVTAGVHSRQYSGGGEHHLQQQLHHQNQHQRLIPSSGTGINASPSPTDLKPPHTNSHLRPLTPKYNARNVSFEYIADIPHDLLAAVALCYQHHTLACRHCFFGSSCRQVTVAKKSLESCSEGHPWRPLVVLPGCRLCSNPTHTVHVPVLPIPRHAKENSAPFSICKKPDHQQCYVVAKTTDPAHPHSVEELVIWTVERERSVPFESVFKSFLPITATDSHMIPETVMFLPASSSSAVATVTTKHGGRGHSPTRRTASSSSSVSRGSTDTSSSRATITYPNGVSLVTDRERGLSVSTDGGNSSGRRSELCTAKSSSSRHVLVGDRGRRDLSAGLASAGGESSDTASVPGSSESVQSSLTSENAIPDQFQQIVGVASENGMATAPVSLFHDPLIYYGSSTSAALQGGEHGAAYDSNDSDKMTLDFFPALRPSVATETPKPAANVLPPLGNELVVDADVDLASTHEIVENQNGTPSEDLTPKKPESVSETERNGEPLQSVEEEEDMLHAEHNRYRSSESSARPENWPDVQHHRTKEDASGGVVVGGDNHQGQRESPPLGSLGSSSGFAMEDREGVAPGDDLVTMTTMEVTGIEESTEEVHNARPDTEKSQAEQNTESVATDNDDRKSVVTKGNGHPGNHQTTAPTETGSSGGTRRDSLDVNAKEFTPRSSILHSDPKPYRSGLNPNAAAVYPYITNGGLPILTTLPPSQLVNPSPTVPPSQLVNPSPTVPPSQLVNPSPTVPPSQLVNPSPTVPPSQLVNPSPTVPEVSTIVGGGGAASLAATGLKMKGPAQPMSDLSSLTATPSNTVPYPTSEISTSPTSSLSPPSSPAHPHKCFLCYQGFPDPPSLRRHCRTAAHISTLLRDCGASTIWKNLPPPPGQPRENMKLCVNGQACTASRLECIQPHFADEFAEQLRRVDHHNKREASRKPLPAFSDQHDSLLISPLERVTQYTTLRVSVREPLKATLTDSFASFTWTISVQGQNWQTLFGIHLKSVSPVFQITDLEDAYTLVDGKCQSDRENWVASSPADAILLGQLSFSVRASPERVNGNYECKVCVNLGFYQHAYISLALIVNDPSLTCKSRAPLPPSLSEFPPISTVAETLPRVSSAPFYKRSPDQPAPHLLPRPQSASSLLDVRDSASDLEQLSQRSLKESTNHHIHPSSSLPATIVVGNILGSGGGGRRWADVGRRRESEIAVKLKTNGQTTESTAQSQDSQESEKSVLVNSHADHMTSNDVIASPAPINSNSHV